jgi:hypothetical protein
MKLNGIMHQDNEKKAQMSSAIDAQFRERACRHFTDFDTIYVRKLLSGCELQ